MVSYFDLLVVDRLSGNSVLVGSLLKRHEASEMKRLFDKYNVDYQLIEYYYKNGKEVYVE